MKATIEASAGTGKTYELTTIVAAAIAGPSIFAPANRGSGLIDGPEFAALLRGGLLHPTEIVLVTYTEAATRELHGRVRSRLAALRQQIVQGVRARQGAGSRRDPVASAPDAGAAMLEPPAAAEAARRIGDALASIDTMAVSTIHSFCDRLVREHGFELGISGAAGELADESALAQEVAMRWWSECVRDDEALSERCRVAGLDRKSIVKFAREAIASRGVALARPCGDGIDSIVADLMRFAREAVAEIIELRGAGTYQDMILRVRDALRSNPRFGAQLRQRVRLGVIDEAQDTDPVQLEIFERIFHVAQAHGPLHGAVEDRSRLLVVVGDPKQAIYGFRGADLEAYLRVRGETAPRRLETNRRSEAGAVEAVNLLFGVKNPFGRDGIDHPPVKAEISPRHGRLVAVGVGEGAGPPPAPIEIHQGAAGESEVEWCVQMLRDLMARGLGIECDGAHRPLQWRDMAVLGRSNARLAMLERRLRTAGVPTTLLGDRTVFESDAADDLAAVLAACAEPGRATRVRRAMVSSLVGVSPSDLRPGTGDPLVEAWSKRFDAWGASARRGGALAIVERALEESPAGVAVRTEVDALHLAELLHAEVGGAAPPEALATALKRLMAASRGEQTRPGDQRRRRIDRADAVTLRTMHTAKGLEYGIVLLPWAGHAMIQRPHHGPKVRVLRAPARALAKVGARCDASVEADESVLVPVALEDPGRALVEQRDREEALRLFYVAVTRARHATLLFTRARSHGSRESVLDALDAVSRADGRVVRIVPASERQGREPAHEGDARGGETGRPRGRASRRALQRPIELWVDTSFSRLSDSAAADPAERLDALAAPATDALRDDEPAPVVTGEAIAGGRLLGRIVHRAFEWAALEGPRADLGLIVDEALAESGMRGRLDAATLVGMIDRTRRAPLGVVGGPLTSLADLEPSQAATEVEFCLPMGHDDAFSPDRLAGALARAPANSPAALFAPVAARLGSGSITGFLRGAIDLLFVHEGRWWIVDYKSNDLGERDEDYRAPSLLDAMERGQYILQYLLYAVAARRLLGLRGVDVHGASWLGGVIYPFVRGVDPREPGRGFFVDRPPVEVLDAMDALLRAPGGAS